jgi:hypothetical protein
MNQARGALTPRAFFRFVAKVVRPWNARIAVAFFTSSKVSRLWLHSQSQGVDSRGTLLIPIVTDIPIALIESD